MASTMVMGVNHVNLSTDVGKTAANTIPQVSYPVLLSMCQGPRQTSSTFSVMLPSSPLREHHLRGVGGRSETRVTGVTNVTMIRN